VPGLRGDLVRLGGVQVGGDAGQQGGLAFVVGELVGERAAVAGQAGGVVEQVGDLAGG
jgi:hypothetical protein